MQNKSTKHTPTAENLHHRTHLGKTLLSLLLSLVIVLTLVPATQAQAKATLKLNKTSASLKVGKTLTLKATRKGTKKKVTWSSNKKSVATVSSSGKVTAKKAGTAVITAKAGSLKAKCTIKVTANKTASVSGKVLYYETFYREDDEGIGDWYTEDDPEPAYPTSVYLIPAKGSKIKGTITLKNITIGSKYKSKYQTKAKYAVRGDIGGKFIFKNVPAGKWLLYVKYSRPRFINKNRRRKKSQ